MKVTQSIIIRMTFQQREREAVSEWPTKMIFSVIVIKKKVKKYFVPFQERTRVDEFLCPQYFWFLIGRLHGAVQEINHRELYLIITVASVGKLAKIFVGIVKSAKPFLGLPQYHN